MVAEMERQDREHIHQEVVLLIFRYKELLILSHGRNQSIYILELLLLVVAEVMHNILELEEELVVVLQE